MNIKQLAKEIRKSHKLTKSWPKTGKQFNITGALAFRIGKQNYEPRTSEIRSKLGLDVRTCSKCGHRHFERKSKPKPDYIIQWDHLPTEERHKVIKQYLKWKEKNGHNN